MGPIFVTGATGALGGRIADRLLDEGADIMIGARRPDIAEGLITSGAEPRRFDYDDPVTMVSALKGAETVVLVPTFAPNAHRVRQHDNALAAAREAGVRRVLFVSFLATSLDSVFIVSPFMLFAEAATRQSGMSWTILRDGLYLDPLAEWMPEIIRMGRIPYPAGSGRLAYVSRDDMARAIAAAALKPEHDGSVFRLTGEKPQDFAEIADIMSRLTGKPIRYDPASDEEFRDMCLEPGLPEYVPDALLSLYHAVAAGEFDFATGDIETLTGTPPESVVSYLERHLP